MFAPIRCALTDVRRNETSPLSRIKTVGYLDGAVLTIGGRWKGSVRGDHADPRIMTVMKLFAGLIVFNPEARRHVKTLARDIRKGRIQPDVHYQEADLYMNPRRVR